MSRFAICRTVGCAEQGRPVPLGPHGDKAVCAMCERESQIVNEPAGDIQRRRYEIIDVFPKVQWADPVRPFTSDEDMLKSLHSLRTFNIPLPVTVVDALIAVVHERMEQKSGK